MKKNLIVTYTLTALVVGIISIIFSCQQNDELKVYAYPEPTVQGFSPSEGYSGTEVTITGSDFGTYKEAVTVFFNGIATTIDQIVSVEDTKIVAIVPEEASTGTVSVKVWTYTKEVDGVFTVIPSVKLASVDAENVQIDDIVTVTGKNFGTDANAMNITISGVSSEIVSISDEEIKFKVPDANSGNIILTLGDQVIVGPFLLIDSELLTGTLIGHSSSWGNNPATFITAAVDGDITTFVDGPTATGYVGYDFGAGKAAKLTSVSYVPRESKETRMIGGEIRGANDPSLSDAVTLYTITDKPATGVYTQVSIFTTESYRYIYYYSADGYCNISEIEFYGKIL